MSHQRSFFDDFPTELIQELVRSLDVDSIDHPHARAFSSVCSAFRKAILNTTELYESIEINLDAGRTQGMCEWLRIKIERSKPSKSLRVCITGKQETTEGGPMLDAALGCCERWGDLNLNNIHPLTLTNLLYPVEGRLESLRRMRISFNLAVPEDMRSTLSAIPPFLKNLPLLDEICILPLPAKNLSFFPLHQIIDCTVAGFNNAGEEKQPLAILLHPESRLQGLSILMHPEAVNSWDGGGPFHAPHLTNLEVVPDPYGDHTQESADCTRLLDSLTAPALKTLTLWHENISATTMFKLAERSKCAIEYLEMGCANPFNDTVRLLTVISSSLTFLFLRIDNLTLLQKFPQFKDPTFLPNLKLWRLALSRGRYQDGRPLIKSLLDPIGDIGESSFIDQVGFARCEIPGLEDPTSLPATLPPGLENLPMPLHFEIEVLQPFITEATAQVFARLPIEGSGLDMELLRALREFSAELEAIMLNRWTPEARSFKEEEFLSKLFDISGKAIQKLDNAQYLYVRELTPLDIYGMLT